MAWRRIGTNADPIHWPWPHLDDPQGDLFLIAHQAEPMFDQNRYRHMASTAHN